MGQKFLPIGPDHGPDERRDEKRHQYHRDRSVEGPADVAEVRRVCSEVNGPVLYNIAGLSPRFSLEEMEEIGIRMAIAPGATFRATMMAVHDLAVALRDQGPMAEFEFNERYKRHPLGDQHTFAGFDRIRAWEEAYLPREEQEKYEGTLGHLPAPPA